MQQQNFCASVGVALMLLICCGSAEELPCNSRSLFNISSNTSYTLTNCTRNVTAFPSVFLTLSPNMNSTTTFDDVVIEVTGGNTLPAVIIPDTAAAVSNISIIVFGVAADGNASVKPSTVVQYGSLFSFQSSTITVQNLSIVVEGLRWNTSVHLPNSSGSYYRVAPLLGIIGNVSADVSGVSLHIADSSIRLDVAGNGMPYNRIGMVWIETNDAGIFHNISITIARSSVMSLAVDSSHATTTYNSTSPALVNILRYLPSTQRESIASSIAFAVDNSTLTLDNLYPRLGSTSDTAAVFSMQDFLVYDNVSVSVVNHSTISVNCTMADVTSATSEPRSRIIQISGMGGNVSVMVDMTVVVKDSYLILFTPMSAVALCWRHSKSLTRFSATMIDTQVDIRTTTLDLGGQTRTQTLLEVSSIDNATSGRVIVQRSNMTFTADSGGCSNVVGTMVNFQDNISNSCVEVIDVNAAFNAVNRIMRTFSAGPIIMSTITMSATLVSVASQLEDGSALSITVINTSVHITHTPIPPTGNPMALLIVSSASLVSIVRSLQQSNVTINNAHMLRLFTGSHALSPPTMNITYNITALVSLFDATATFSNTLKSQLLEKYQVLDFLTPLLAQLFPSAPAKFMQVNVSVLISGNSTITYGVTQSASDCVSLIILPSASLRCRYIIEDSLPLEASSGGSSGGGAVIGSVGSTNLNDSTISATNINGLSMLYFAMLSPVQFFPGTTMRFENVSLVMRPYGQEMNYYAIGVQEPASIKVEMITGSSPWDATSSTQSLTPPPEIFIVHCIFRGSFRQLLMPNKVRLSQLPTPLISPRSRASRSFFLFLGCNLWENGIPMTTSKITNDIELLTFVNYPDSVYNESVHCAGFHTPSQSLSFPYHRSSTTTAELPIIIDVDDPVVSQIPSTVLTTFTSVAGILSAVLAFGDGGALDAQVLIAMGTSPCAPESLSGNGGGSTSSQFLLSPFYALGDIGMVFGNLGVFIVVCGVHRMLLAKRLKLWYERKPLDTSIFPTTMECGDSKMAHSMHPQQQQQQQLRPEASLKYPNHSIGAAILLAPGIVVGGVRGLFSGDAASITSGVVALLSIGAAAWWRVREGRTRTVAKLMRFVPYRHGVRMSFIMPSALPLGQWGPTAARATHGRLRGAVRVGKEWLSAYSIAVSLTAQAIASIGVPSSWCTGLWFVLCAIQLLAVIVVAVHRPARTPLVDVLQSCCWTMAALIQLLAGLAMSADLNAADLATAMSALSLVKMCVSVVKSAHSVFVLWWERQQHQQQQDEHVASKNQNARMLKDLPTTTTAARTNNTRRITSVVHLNVESQIGSPRDTNDDSNEEQVLFALRELLKAICDAQG